MKGNLYDRMFHALEWMDEGVEPKEYLIQRFMPRNPTWERTFIVIGIAEDVIEAFYANYW